MEKLSLQQIQNSSLEILKKVDQLCLQLNLHYYIAYGTLIGVIRHHGFIPWDDDLDIQMPRRDFNILMEYFTTHEQELYPLKVCNRENTKNYTYAIPRITDSRYIMKSTLVNEIDTECGTFIDVYPLDAMGTSEYSALKTWKKIDFLNKLYSLYINGKGIGNSKITFFKYPLHLLLHLMGKSFPQYIQKKTERLLSQYDWDSSNYVGPLVWGTFFETYKKEIYAQTERKLFENIEVTIPKDYDFILRYIYDDYMKLPPIEQRIGHHFYDIYRKDT